MLQLLNQFVLKQAIRTPAYLLNPVVVQQEYVSLPRLSILHFLDTSIENHFPSRSMVYFKDIPDNKKIPIFTIPDLLVKEEIGTLLNKQSNAEIRKWQQTNIKQFKALDLLETPNKDVNLISIYNYNILVDLYKYRTSLLSSYYKFYNLAYTHWTYVSRAIKADTDSAQFVSIDLPNNIPNINVILAVLKFSINKYTRVITDDKLLRVLDVFKWLVKDTRETSTMKDITDEDSKRIMIEFRYRGYSSFLPLHILRGLSKESELDSSVKIPDLKLQKLYILMLHRIQDKINAILEDNVEVIEEEGVKDIRSEEDESDHENDQDDSGDVYLTDKVQGIGDTTKSSVSSLNKSSLDVKHISSKQLESTIDSKITSDISKDLFDKALDTELLQFDETNKDLDELYEETILKVEQEAEDKDSTPIKTNYSVEHREKTLADKTTQEKFDLHIQEAVKFKTHTTTEIRALKKLREERKSLKSPYNNTMSIDEFKVVTKEDVELTDKDVELDIDNNIVNSNLKKNIIQVFDDKYINKVLKKDIAACITKLESSNIIVKNYTIEESRTALGNHEVHRITVKPLNSPESTLLFRIPIIDSEGEFVASSIKYKMRKTKQDLPIRKISKIKVALSSNYCKLFIQRTERRAFDPYTFISNYIKESYLNEEGVVIKLIPGGKNRHLLKLPNIYAHLSSDFIEVHTNKFTFLLDPQEVYNRVDKHIVKDLEIKRLTFCGYLANKNILVVDMDDIFHDYTSNMTRIGNICTLLDIEQDKLPKPFTSFKVLGDNVALGLAMSYYIGLDNLLSITNTEVKLIEANKQYKAQEGELVLKFNDYKLVCLSPSKEAQLLLNSFLYYKDFIKEHPLEQFNYKDIYLNMLEFRDCGLMHIKELNLLQELFVDPITAEVLESMKEPKDYLKLLLRANELLKDFSYPDIHDPNFSRIRGYDRIPGLMYRAITESVRDHRFKNNSRSKIELDPYKVWNYITQDNTVKITEDINPILDIKESETITLAGQDGLNKDAVPVLLRRYHKNDMGLISEGTVDSSEVAINMYLTAYPKFKDLRGVINADSTEHMENKSKIFSTSVMLSPMAEHDDPKRIN